MTDNSGMQSKPRQVKIRPHNYTLAIKISIYLNCRSPRKNWPLCHVDTTVVKGRLL